MNELTFNTFHADLTINYSTLGASVTAAAVCAGVCLVVNLTFYYISPTDIRKSLLSRPSADAPEGGRRVTIGAITVAPKIGDEGVHEVSEDMNHGDIYANTGKM